METKVGKDMDFSSGGGLHSPFMINCSWWTPVVALNRVLLTWCSTRESGTKRHHSLICHLFEIHRG